MKRTRARQESKAKNWVFTVNNPSDDDSLTPEAWPACSFACWQKESGEAGTPHFQGYVQFSERITLSEMKTLLGLERAHFEVARGSPEANRVYCSKEEGRLDGPFSWGTISGGQGTRTDILAVKDAVDAGASRADLYEDHFATYLRMERAINNYKSFRAVARSTAPVVLLFVGLAGMGKSRSAWTLANMLGSVYMCPRPKGSGSYFDKYDNQDVFYIDEMSGAFCTPTFFNCLCDRYPMEIPVHGGVGHQFNSPYIIITANRIPSMWWKVDFNLAAIMRRITVIIKYFPIVPRVRTVVYNPATSQFIHQ